jgi:hypothetical protein
MRAAVDAKRATPSEALRRVSGLPSACINSADQIGTLACQQHAESVADAQDNNGSLNHRNVEINGFACMRIAAMRFTRWCHAWRGMASLTQNGHAGLGPS